MSKKAENKEIQQKIEAFILRCFNWGYDEEQIIGFIMLNENLFYDDAKKHFEIADKKIKQ